jgi:hypothetical protein
MTDNDKTQGFKLVIADGAFDDVPEEDREELMKEIQAAFERGDFFTQGEPVDLDELEREEPEVYEKLVTQIEKMDVEKEGQEPPTLH